MFGHFLIHQGRLCEAFASFLDHAEWQEVSLLATVLDFWKAKTEEDYSKYRTNGMAKTALMSALIDATWNGPMGCDSEKLISDGLEIAAREDYRETKEAREALQVVMEKYEAIRAEEAAKKAAAEAAAKRKEARKARPKPELVKAAPKRNARRKKAA